MSRIEFDGTGTPIPKIALPPFGSDEDVPPTLMMFTEDSVFPAAQYRNLGFTHFEVMCVGAAGGRGGNATGDIFLGIDYYARQAPQDIWNLHIESVRMYNAFNYRMGLDTHYFGTWSNGYWSHSAGQWEEAINPQHIMPFGVHKQIVLRPTPEGMGGGGGGGGFHKVVGELADLPDSVPIVVGKAGVDSPFGQSRVPGVWTPDMDAPAIGPDSLVIGYFEPTVRTGAAQVITRTYANFPQEPSWVRDTHNRWVDIENYLDRYLFSYPVPPAHNSFAPPQPGGDGGASTFGGTVAQASGGQGGAPGKVYTGFPPLLPGQYRHFYETGYTPVGHGGDGGIGGSSTPGGGGKGSVTDGVNGSDGIWRPELGIGEGGGGGRGGRGYNKFSRPEFNALATAGGQGSYSYADTSVYGPRQLRSAYLPPNMWTKTKYFGEVGIPTIGSRSYFGGGNTTVPNGEIDYDYYGGRQFNESLVIPGGGGGARPLKNVKHGSYAPGFSPNGVVVLRLAKIT